MKEVIVGVVRTWDPLSNCGELYSGALSALRTLRDVQVVEAPCEIGGAGDAEIVCGAFEAAGVDLTVLMCCRLAGDGRIVEPFMRSKQELVVWCIPEPGRTGPLLLNSMTCANLYMSAAKQMEAECGGKRAKWLYGMPEDAYMLRRLTVTIDALRARKALDGAVLVRIGETASGFTNLRYDAEKIAQRLGTKIVEYPLESIFQDMAAVEPAEVEALVAKLPGASRRCEASEAELDLTARLILAMRGLRERFHAAAFAVSCWPEFQRDLHVSTCLAFAVLNQEGLPVSCEGDVPGALTMLLAQAVSGKAPMLMDLVAMDPAADALSFWHCGMGLPCYADGDGYALTKYPADPRVLDLPGVSVDVKFAPRPVTICRLGGDGASELLACQAMIVPGPDRGYDGARGWFSGFEMGGKAISAAEFFDTVCTCGNPHHYIICPGHFEPALRELAVRCKMEVMQAAPYSGALRG